MKTLSSKIIFVAIVVFIFAAVAILARAQQGGSTTHRVPVTTNWVGFAVAGQNDSGDRIALSGASPTVMYDVQIGLRSDGLVVWKQVGPQMHIRRLAR